jgi:glycerol-3-phosphate dehydrogenase (NAD(P)+)
MSDNSIKSAAILGSGSFGTAIAKLLAKDLESLLIYGRDSDSIAAINNEHKNPRYLKGIELPKQIRATSEIADVVNHPLVIFAVPTSATRQCAEQLATCGLPKTTVLLSCAKGIEKNTGDRMSEILRKIFPENPIAVLSGPNHAEEIATAQADRTITRLPVRYRNFSPNPISVLTQAMTSQE